MPEVHARAPGSRDVEEGAHQALPHRAYITILQTPLPHEKQKCAACTEVFERDSHHEKSEEAQKDRNRCLQAPQDSTTLLEEASGATFYKANKGCHDPELVQNGDLAKAL